MTAVRSTDLGAVVRDVVRRIVAEPGVPVRAVDRSALLGPWRPVLGAVLGDARPLEFVPAVTLERGLVAVTVVEVVANRAGDRRLGNRFAGYGSVLAAELYGRGYTVGAVANLAGVTLRRVGVTRTSGQLRTA